MDPPKRQWKVRPFAPGFETVGAIGENSARRRYGIPPKQCTFGIVGPDGGIDFWLLLHTKDGGIVAKSIDTKSARHPRWLWVEEGTVKADIYIFVGVDDYLGVGELGWVTKAEVLAAPITTDPNGVWHHQLERNQLRRDDRAGPDG